MFYLWLLWYSFCFVVFIKVQKCFCLFEIPPCDKNAIIFAPDELDEIEYATTVDILRRAKINLTQAHEYLHIENILSRHELNLCLQISYTKIHKNEPDKVFDLIVIPGGNGIVYLSDNDIAMKTIEKHIKKNKIVALIGEAPRILGFGKWFYGKSITCDHRLISEMIQNYKFTGESTTVDGNLITSCCPSTSMEFALTIVEKMQDARVADQIASDLGYNYKSVIRAS